MSPHRSFCMLNRLRAVLARSYPDGVLDPDDEDLAVPDLALPGPAGDRELVDHGVHDLRPHHRLDLQSRPERDVHGCAAVLFGVTPLRAASLDLGHGHA